MIGLVARQSPPPSASELQGTFLFGQQSPAEICELCDISSREKHLISIGNVIACQLVARMSERAQLPQTLRRTSLLDGGSWRCSRSRRRSGWFHIKYSCKSDGYSLRVRCACCSDESYYHATALTNPTEDPVAKPIAPAPKQKPKSAPVVRPRMPALAVASASIRNMLCSLRVSPSGFTWPAAMRPY